MEKLALQLLSGRVIQCLGILSDHEDYITMNALADQLKISKRTLFRELKDIDSFLEPFDVSLNSKTGLGIRLDGAKEKIRLFKRHLLEIALQQSEFSREDRQTFLLSELLKNQQLNKFIVYANQFGVSEATISHDINALEPQLRKYNLSLTRKPGLNLSIEGDEESKRKAIRDFIYLHVEESKFTALLNTNTPYDIESYFENQGPDSILQILNKDVLWKVIDVLKANDFFWVNRLAQNAYVGLILHLTIAIERMFNQDVIQMDQDLLEKLKKDQMFERAKDLSEYFEEEFDLNFPDEEIAYISMHLKGARLLQVDQDIHTQEDEVELPQLKHMIHRLIFEFEKCADVHFVEDDLLINGLITHLRPALTRIKYSMEIRNPLLKQIKEQYPQVFKHAKDTVANLNDPQFMQLNDDEIAFIAMHFGAALERLKQSKKRVVLNVAVICASGIGISSLLASRLKSQFKDAIKVEARSQLEEDSFQESPYDFIVSTMGSLKTNVPLIHVNPLLSDEDINQIQVLINQISLLKNSVEDEEKPQAWNIHLGLIAEMTTQINALIQGIDVIYVDETLSIKDLMKQIALSITDSKEHASTLIEDLMKREAMGEVLLEEEHIVLFHARSSCCTEAKMMILRPLQNLFTSFAPSKIQTILVLLVPMTAVMELNRWISRLSAAMIEDDRYLRALHDLNKEDIKQEVIRLLEVPYKEWMKKKL